MPNPSRNEKWAKTGFCHIGRRLRPVANACTLPMEPPPKRADPAIYSQAEEIRRGREPTWLNPDLRSYIHTGSPPLTFVNVTNRDPEVAAANVLVHMSAGTFGIGTETHLLATRSLYLAPGSSEETVFLGSPSSDERLSIELEFPTDRDFGNNEGGFAARSVWFEAGSEQEVMLPVRNPYATPHLFTLHVVSAQARGEPGNSQVALEALEERDIPLTLFLPEDVDNHESYGLTVYATDDLGELVGGVTYVLGRR